MLPKLLSFLSLATTTLADPLFYLASTSNLPILHTDNVPNIPASQVQNLLWRSLSTCPNTHYAVVIEPRTLDHDVDNTDIPSLLLPTTPNTASSYLAHNITGRVNIVHVLNTILMDCLHHGVLRVEELDTSHYSPMLPELNPETVRKSIIYARMPEVDVHLDKTDYVHTMHTRKDWVERAVRKYFGNEDYMLIYWREELVPAVRPVVTDKVVPTLEFEFEEGEDGEQNPLAEEELRI